LTTGELGGDLQKEGEIFQALTFENPDFQIQILLFDRLRQPYFTFCLDQRIALGIRVIPFFQGGL